MTRFPLKVQILFLVQGKILWKNKFVLLFNSVMFVNYNVVVLILLLSWQIVKKLLNANFPSVQVQNRLESRKKYNPKASKEKAKTQG